MATDAEKVGAAFARHYAQYDTSATVQREIAERLDALLGEYCPHLTVRRALEIGIGTGFLTRLVTARYPDAEWYFNDLTPAAFDWIPAGLRQVITLPGDAESICYPNRLDLITSASALQWFDDLPAFFTKARQVMHPGAVLAIASFTAGHFEELARVSDSPLHYPTDAELGSMVTKAGFTLLHTLSWSKTLHFDTARNLLVHLRCTGVNGRSAAAIRTPAQLSSFEECYRQATLSLCTSLPLTYRPTILIAQSGTASRQAPTSLPSGAR